MPADEDESADPWIPYARQCIEDSDIESVISTLKSDFVTQGPRVEYFQDALCEYTGAQYAVAVSNGTAALHLAYQGLGVEKGDVGIVPSITFVATANGLRYCGAKPVFCDVNGGTGLSDQAHFEAGIQNAELTSGKAKILVPVSFTGRMCDLESLSHLAAKHGSFIVEDAAHSLGAAMNGVKSASCVYSDAAILSFHPVKHICTGEGGAVLTNDEALARRVRRLRSHGIVKPDSLLESEGAWAYSQDELGWNYRMTDIQASLGSSQLLRIDSFMERRREIALRYHDAFADEACLRHFERPELKEGLAWHLYVIRFRSSDLRRKAYDFLRAKHIGTQVHYVPVYRHPYYSDLNVSQYPGAEAFYSGCLSLPMYPSLKDADRDRVVKVLKQFCQSESL